VAAPAASRSSSRSCWARAGRTAAARPVVLRDGNPARADRPPPGSAGARARGSGNGTGAPRAAAPEERAIDEVEHDLASLGAIFRLDRGRTRYRLDLNAGLARSLRPRWARSRPRFTAYDGSVQIGPGTQDAFLASRLTARSYSPSALQRFAACPYQFFLSAICRLAPREEIAPLGRLDPLTRGSLFHGVQAECLRALQHSEALPVTPGTLAAARRVLDRTLDRVARVYEEKLAPAIARA